MDTNQGDEPFLLVERSEEDLIRKRRAYINRRVGRALKGLFLDQSKNAAVDNLTHRLEKLTTREIERYILSGRLPDIPEDTGSIRSAKSATEITNLDVQVIRDIARLIVEKREKELERTISQKQIRRNMIISVVALIVSSMSAVSVAYKTFIEEPRVASDSQED